jgi:hypothetical protein
MRFGLNTGRQGAAKVFFSWRNAVSHPGQPSHRLPLDAGRAGAMGPAALRQAAGLPGFAVPGSAPARRNHLVRPG